MVLKGRKNDIQGTKFWLYWLLTVFSLKVQLYTNPSKYGHGVTEKTDPLTYGYDYWNLSVPYNLMVDLVSIFNMDRHEDDLNDINKFLLVRYIQHTSIMIKTGTNYWI